MGLIFDGQLTIAVGRSAKSKIWKNVKVQWSALAAKLTTENRTNETIAEFLAATREEQLQIKDVGGYVGGYLRNGRRNPENVLSRQLLTLDVDFGYPQFWDDFRMAYHNAAVVHGSHKSTEDAPRLRLVMPFAREVSRDEYTAISRRVAGDLGIGLFDPSTFESNRLMFWPSTPKDVPFYSMLQDGPWLDPDAVLATYADWHDSSEWPVDGGYMDKVRDACTKQEDPAEKKGLVGVFCRAYPIEDAISIFLPDVYKPAAVPGRYTYLKGSTAAGLITYGGKFAYSHHGTDPAGGQLCNSYDLVRIHKFGHLSKEESQRAMDRFVKGDEGLRLQLAQERLESARYDFAVPMDLEAKTVHVDIEDPESLEWMKKLEIDSRGQYLCNDTNLNAIFANDASLIGLFRLNEFDSRPYVWHDAPWRPVPAPEPMKNADLSGIRNYIGTIYGITANQKVEDAVTLELERNRFHPVRDYLNGLVWDGLPRVASVLHDYLGARDTAYTRDAMLKTLAGAVARVMAPGTKFDLVLVLEGPQGIGKSTLVKKLGMQWFSDTFMNIQGKDAYEQLQGAWLIELGELAGLRRAEVETIKHFISKSEDFFRPAYGRVVEAFPRQCVFIGTTNSAEFLKDSTGNRRFMPVTCHEVPPCKNIFTMEQKEIDQIWAEACEYYKKGGALYINNEDVSREAERERRRHSELDPRTGEVAKFLDIPLPENWDDLDQYARRDYYEDPTTQVGCIEREYVTGIEVWCECFGRHKSDYDVNKAKEIAAILDGIPGWTRAQGQIRTKLYGKQRYYFRNLD